MANEPERERRFAVTPKELIAVALSILAVVFVFENTKSTEVRFIVPRVDSPLWVALVAAVALGFVIGWFVGRRRKD